MVRERLDDLVEVIRVARLEGFGDAGVQRAAALVQQAVIGDAPGEPVPEGVGDVREQPRLVQELARPQVGQRAMQLLRRQLGHGLEERERHVLADHRGELQRRLLGRAEPVDARGDDRGDARRDLDLVRAAGSGGRRRGRRTARPCPTRMRTLSSRNSGLPSLASSSRCLSSDEIGRVAEQAREQLARRPPPRADRCAAACSAPGCPSRADTPGGS